MTGIGISNFVTFAKMNIFKVKINFEEADHETIELPIAEGESVLDVCLENLACPMRGALKPIHCHLEMPH